MKKLVHQFVRFAILPFVIVLLLLITYLCTDPFKVIYKYNAFYKNGEPQYVDLNRDYVAVESFLNNFKTYNYNSFILGNSRSRSFQMDTWSKYIKSDKCFHFDASAESLYGINKKIELLDKMNVNFSNVLLVLDKNILSQVINLTKYPLFTKHPILSGQNRFMFHFNYFVNFLNFKFLRAFIDLKLTGKSKKYMIEHQLFNDEPVEYILKYNEVGFKKVDSIIENDPLKFYNSKKMNVFYPRDSIQKFNPKIIEEPQLILLKNICRILKKHNVNYKLVINPLYDQMKINKKDLKILNDIFGKQNVYDFSGINTFTNDYHNYYEDSHYRTIVSSKIMKIIYSE